MFYDDPSIDFLVAALPRDTPWSPLFDHCAMAIAVLTPRFAYYRVNDAYAAADGRRPDDYLGRHHFVLHPNSKLEAIFTEVRESGKPYSHRAVPYERGMDPRRGIGRWNWHLHPLPESVGGALLLVMKDVTAQLRAQERGLGDLSLTKDTR